MGRPGLCERCPHLRRELDSSRPISSVSLVPSIHSVETLVATNRNQQLWSFLEAQEILLISCFLDLLDSGKKWGRGVYLMDCQGKGDSRECEAWVQSPYITFTGYYGPRH